MSADDSESADVAQTAEPTVEADLPLDPGAPTIRRLNRTEYNNIVRDLLGDTSRPADTFPVDPIGDGFDNEVEVQSVPIVLMEKYAEAAEGLVASALADPPRRAALLPCAPDGAGREACARRILTDFARRAFRRPVSDAEIDRLLALAAGVEADGGDALEGVALALEAVLVDPSFLFVVETDPDPTSPTPHRLTDHELATRLSLFLYRSMPDAELAAAADAGRLHDRAELGRQIDRMLADPRAADFARDFSDQWLLTRALLEATPSRDRFPRFDAPLRQAMADETRLVFAEFLNGDRDYRGLLDGEDTFVNERLARHYGIAGVSGGGLRRVSTAGTRRGGLLAHGSVLVATATPNHGSIPKRGRFILSNLLCRSLDGPPPGIPALPDAPAPGTTRREILERYTGDNPSCRGCHGWLNPLGGGLEHFDAVGAYREEENGSAIDATGELPDGTSFDGHLEEARALAQDPAFGRCLTRKLFGFALGRVPGPRDEPALDEVEAVRGARGDHLRDVVHAIATSPAFTTRRGEAP